MSLLVDTCVLSELVKPRANERVVAWMREAPATGLFISVLTLGEIRSGTERLGPGPRQERLRLWLERDIPRLFEGRILSVDAGVADRWGRLLAGAGRSVPAIDALLAATALQHRLRLVTRNRGDYPFPDLDLIDPWSS